MEYVHQIIVDVSDKTLWVGDKVYPVKINDTETLPGLYEVAGIYLNTPMKTPTGQILPPSLFGGIVVDLKGTDIAIHSGKEILSGQQSSGCVRLDTSNIRDIINQYYFNKVLIQL
jgi:lipoprotein-anchoring transpeptidase ErfK/SrfK